MVRFFLPLPAAARRASAGFALFALSLFSLFASFSALLVASVCPSLVSVPLRWRWGVFCVCPVAFFPLVLGVFGLFFSLFLSGGVSL